MSTSPDTARAKNLRLGLILGSVALAFFAGFVVKVALFGL